MTFDIIHRQKRMFAVHPRCSDSSSDFRIREEISNPWLMRYPIRRGDFTMAAGRESEVENTDKEYCIRLDLHHYSPEEVKITCENHQVTIKAKHGEKQDNHGYVSREVTRVYKLPEDVDCKSMTSKMNAQCILCLKALKQALEAPKETAISDDVKG